MNYLIHTGPGIGDIIQFLSMARAIKEQDKDARVDFLMRGSEKAFSIDSEIMQLQHYADNLYWYASKEVMHDISLIRTLRKAKYDYGFVRIGSVTGNPSLWIYRIMRIVGCRIVIGTGTSKVDKLVEVPEEAHYLDRNAMLLEQSNIKGRTDAVAIDKSLLDKEWIASLNIPSGMPKVALSFGTNSMKWNDGKEVITYDVKSWPYDRWIELAGMLTSHGFFVFLIGGPKERHEVIEAGLSIPKGDSICDLVGKTNIKQSLTALNECNLVVGAEGGMMHCASSLGVQTLTIFGGSDYRKWNPGGKNSAMLNLHMECAPCFCTQVGAKCSDHKCLNGITVRMVFDTIKTLIE